jgi:hypothetical protein
MPVNGPVVHKSNAKVTTVLKLISLVLISLALFAMPFESSWSASYALKGELAGIAIDTRVDSPLVQAMFDESQTDSSRISCPGDDPIPSAESLRSVTKSYSPDVATLVLIQCLARIPDIQRSQYLFLQELAAVRRGEDARRRAFLDARARQYLVLFMPGWSYQSNGHITGADLRIPRQILSDAGFENYLVPIPEAGSVSQNAAILADAIERYNHKQIIIVSASSAGPAVALALGENAQRNARVAGWLNIGGVLRGAPIIDYFQPWTKSWLLRIACMVEGWEYSHIRSLSMAESKPRFSALTLPSHITVVNYIGIPFSGDITDFAADFYPILKKLGPNDGLTLITDALAPGYTIMAVGSDHFVREDPEIDLKTAALVPTLFKLMQVDEVK